MNTTTAYCTNCGAKNGETCAQHQQIMSIPHYAYNERVYLRRDPSQYGHIGTISADGAIYDAKERVQPVFWEHKDAGEIVSVEPIADLMSEAEYQYHERRRLFFSLMRRPDMRLMRLALRSLANDGIDWRDIDSLEMLCIPTVHGSWLLATERFMVHCVAPNSSTLTYEDFSTYWNHVEEHGGRADSNPDCKCLDCRWQAVQSERTPR